MLTRATLRPVGPYSLALSARGLPCATRRMTGGTLRLVLRAGGSAALAAVTQKRDGMLDVLVDGPDPDAALHRLRFLLAVDLDLRPFYAAVADDPLLYPITQRLRGSRPLRLDSPAHALLRGITGQLVRSTEAHRIERQAVRAVGTPHGDLWLAPTSDDLRRLSPAQLRSFGLAERRARLLARAARELDLEALETLDTPAAVAKMTRVPGIGSWTAAVVCLQGLGRTDHGFAGDLGLDKILARQTGEVPAGDAAARLLDRYAPYQGLASVYLLTGGGAAKIPATVGEIARAVAYSGGRSPGFGGASRTRPTRDPSMWPSPG